MVFLYNLSLNFATLEINIYLPNRKKYELYLLVVKKCVGGKEVALTFQSSLK